VITRRAGYTRPSASRICDVESVLPSLTTITSWFGVSLDAIWSARNHETGDVPLSL
jgi:hypothetical protein